jgi:hypothetical protein
MITLTVKDPRTIELLREMLNDRLDSLKRDWNDFTFKIKDVKRAAQVDADCARIMTMLDQVGHSAAGPRQWSDEPEQEE